MIGARYRTDSETTDEQVNSYRYSYSVFSTNIQYWQNQTQQFDDFFSNSVLNFQCIPESISEVHDSAVDDLVDDSDIAEDDDETDNDKSPNCNIIVNVPSLPINLGKKILKMLKIL